MPSKNLLQKLTSEDLAYQSPAMFAKYASKRKWMAPKHLRLLNKYLKRIESGKSKRLAVFMPPRHGKSEFISKYFPAWYLGRNPDHRIIEAAYETRFAASWGQKARDLLIEHGEDVFGINIRRDIRARAEWAIEGHLGGMTAAGVNGPITGKGANVFIIDDPIKNAEEALSEVYRENTWDWFTSTAYTRLEPDGAIILIMTRWHMDDLGGRVLRDMEQGGEHWDVLSFPAIAKTYDAIGRKPGEALWPERFDEEALDRIRRVQKGSFWWSAMYDQDPAPPEGNLFKRKWWRYYVEVPSESAFEFIYQSWDTTFKDLDTSDYVVGQVWGKLKATGDMYLLDQYRGRTTALGMVDHIYRLKDKYPSTSGYLIEDKANGPTVISMLRDKKLTGVMPIETKGTKEARAAGCSIYVESGNIWLPSPKIAGGWIEEFISELSFFPRGEHDDQVDAFTQACDKMMARRPGGLIISHQPGVVG